VTVQRTRVAALVALLVLVAAPAVADHAWAPVLTIDPESAKALMDRGQRVEPLDLRPEPEFRGGRLPRARSMPLAELRDRVDEVPPHGVVILYCGCGQAELLRAYQFLRGRRYANVYLLEGGLDAWVRLGYPLER
jgi:rhodanese-related sulfurtransferase